MALTIGAVVAVWAGLPPALLLVLLVCPLMMFAMHGMHGMHGGHAGTRGEGHGRDHADDGARRQN
ncbi:DUF2933 domain-containing protein [Sporichthya polymorpha]|uniref:DUF2933 domain-containing protein n=1 Tax=Sporichthya polymorpha TaxID=35751 RepID=UPI001B7FD31C|nr:DUF2933 domain-containing protein [Sporichthya polymorpha]